MWRALASPIRRRILDSLRGGPRTTADIAALFPGHSRFAVMQHLGVLEEGRLVTFQRVGRQRFNYLNPVPIQQIYRRWVSEYQAPWAASLTAMKESLESEASRARRRTQRGKKSG